MASLECCGALAVCTSLMTVQSCGPVAEIGGFLLLIHLAVAAGAIYVGWTAYKNQEDDRLNASEASSTGVKPQSKSQVRDLIGSILGDTRNQQLQEYAPNEDEKGINIAGKEATRSVVIASISLGLAIAGYMFFAPLVLLSLPGVLYTSRHIGRGASKSLKERKISVDIIYALLEILLVLGRYWMILNVTLWIYTLNRKMIAKIKDHSRKAIVDVFSRQPGFAWVHCDGVEVKTPLEALEHGDIVVVNAGETIPVDGSITEGMATVDQHLLTGEFQPSEKGIGDQVFALTVILSGKIFVQVEKAGVETTASRVGQLLEQTVDYRTDDQLWAEGMTDKLCFPAMVLAGLAFPVLGYTSALTILHSHPRNKLTFAAAIGNMNFLNLAAKKGILIKAGRTTERLNHVDTVVFDKTGTLTAEQPTVGRIHLCNGYGEHEILQYAAAAEYRQTHPIAKAILQEAATRNLVIPEIDEANYDVGYGLTVRLGGQLVRVGSSRFLEKEGILTPESVQELQELCQTKGHSLMMVAIDGEVGGCIELQPTIRPEAPTVIRELRKRNIKSIYIISGDHEAPTRDLSEKLGVDDYFAEVLPENKAEIIKQLQNEAKSVCYVGDGINDSIALKQADVSISLHGASTLATDTAQIILMDQSLKQLCPLIDLAREYDANLKSSYSIILAPAILCISGVFFLGFGLVQSTMLGQAGLLAGVASSMWPLWRHRKDQLSAASKVSSGALLPPDSSDVR